MSALAKEFGILRLINVELPAKDAADQARMDEMNAQLAGTGFRTARFAYDWGFCAFSELQKEGRPQVSALKVGDLVQVFKSVSAGAVAWEGEIDFTKNKSPRGVQKGFERKNWALMFYSHFPARLERDGKTIFGALDPFSETGSEGTIWSVSEYGKVGYDGLHHLRNGDKLTVYKSVSAGDVEWEGALAFGPQAVSQVEHGHEVMRETTHVETKKWLEFSFQKRPVAIVPGV